MAIAEKLQSNRPMSIRAFAEAAETSPRRIRRLIRQGRLRTVENQAGEVRIPESELQRLLKWKESRALRQSMEGPAVCTERSLELVPTRRSVEVAPQASMETPGPVSVELQAMHVPLARHEAAVMRLGYLESELACTKRLLKDSVDREDNLRHRADQSEQEAISATVRAVEAENQLEEMRAQVIDSTFRAVELQEQVKQLQERLMTPFWRRPWFGLRPSP